MELVHATCVEYDGAGILIIGPSGSGKSDLALRLIGAGAILISDDYVRLEECNGKIFARTAPNIEGKLEVRGIGLMDVPYKEVAEIKFVLQLKERDKIERLPEKKFFKFGCCEVVELDFDAFAVSAIEKIDIFMKYS